MYVRMSDLAAEATPADRVQPPAGDQARSFFGRVRSLKWWQVGVGAIVAGGIVAVGKKTMRTPPRRNRRRRNP